jgi:hypothetical protein
MVRPPRPRESTRATAPARRQQSGLLANYTNARRGMAHMKSPVPLKLGRKEKGSVRYTRPVNVN